MGTQILSKEKPSSSYIEVIAAAGLIFLAICLVGLAGIDFLWAENRGPYKATTRVADLNGDGSLDVILATTRWESESGSFAGIKLWINQGGGKFLPDASEQPGGFSADAGDVDGDGDTDLLVLDGAYLTLSLNQGGAQGGKNGEFKINNSNQPSNHWSGHIDMGGSVVFGDLNQDGQVDAFIAGCCYLPGGDPYLVPSSSWMWINEWKQNERLMGRTSILAELEGLPLRGTALGDLDGNGSLDVFAAVGTNQTGKDPRAADRVLLNDGSGGLRDSGQRLGETDSTNVALGDIDGDDDLDALVGTRDGAAVWINQGRVQGGSTGVFSSGQVIDTGPIRAVFLADLDGDGDLDALLGGLQQAAIWWNNGQGTLTRSGLVFNYSERHGLAVGDFNNDGSPDILAASGSDSCLVWLNQGNGVFRFVR
jgi:hypothetical protein